MSYQDEEEQAAGPIDELAEASPPNDLRNIRACKRCGILKTTEQFYEQGCENCPFLDMPEDMRMVNNFTTAFFEGHVAVMDPRESWAAKWIRVDAYLPGTFTFCLHRSPCSPG